MQCHIDSSNRIFMLCDNIAANKNAGLLPPT
jgi:hypothetical protein